MFNLKILTMLFNYNYLCQEIEFTMIDKVEWLPFCKFVHCSIKITIDATQPKTAVDK